MPSEGWRLSTSAIAMPLLFNTSLASEGSVGVTMTTSGYLEQTFAKDWWSTRAPARYEFFVKSVTKAAFMAERN